MVLQASRSSGAGKDDKYMKRRHFFTAAAALGAGTAAGCSRAVKVKQELSPYAFDTKVAKPVGTMTYSELGTTGIKVSKFGFGSHMRQDIVPFEKEREFMIREAHDLGITLFDIYDKEQECYQYEPMGRYLKPVINDVVISISILPWDGRTLEQEMERDLRAFGRDHIDMVRIHSYTSDSSNWVQWESLFKWKEQGKIRAVGIPIHNLDNIREPLEKLPLDYVIFPFNFYHNWTWLSNELAVGRHDSFDDLVTELRSRGIGVVTMKPHAGDDLVWPFKRLAAESDPSVNLGKADLKYVINSGLDIDTTLSGMYYPYHVYENVDAYFNPAMTDAERLVLKKIRDKARITAHNWYRRYQFLEAWRPDSYGDDRDLWRTA